MPEDIRPPAPAPQLPAEVASLLADGRPFVRCACGFVAMSTSAIENGNALEDHPCPYASDVVATDRWYHHVFSLWGVIMFFLLCAVILAVLAKAKW